MRKRLFVILLLLASLAPRAVSAHEDAQAYLACGAYNEAYIMARASGDEKVMGLALAQIAERPELWRVRWEEGKAGYADVSGAWRIAPQFFFARNFSEEGYAPAKQARNRMGVIDRTGAFVVPPEWEAVREIRDGYVLVSERENGRGRWGCGIIDLAGRVIIEPKYEYLELPSEGLIVAGRLDYRMGYLDLTGKWAIGQRFSRVSSFHDGVARAWEAGAAKYARAGKIDREGNWIERPKWQDITEPDAEGRRFVCKQSGGQWGLIGADGLWLIRPRWDVLHEPDGMGNRAARADDLWGLIDANGGWLVKPCWLNVSLPDDQGVRAVRAADGLWGMIDANGNWLMQPGFHCEWLSAFSAYGYALYRDAEGVGTLDRGYQEVWHVPCESFGKFQDGVAALTRAQGCEEGCIDFLGNLLWMGKKEI